MEDGRDLLPQPRADPERIAGIDRLPRAARRWGFAPGPAAVHHSEHALQLASQIAAGTPSAWRGGLHERRDLLPVGLAQLGGPGHDPDGNRPWRREARLRRWR